MYIPLLKVFCSSFSAVAVCTFDWSMDNLLGTHKKNVWLTVFAFKCKSIKKKGIHGNYRVKVNDGKWSAWHMKMIWKLQYEFADAKINILTG